MKRIAVVTATRAEYGLLAPVIKELRKQESDGFRTELIVTGTHLSAAFGNTVSEIEADHIRIDKRIKIPVASSAETDISANQADVLIKFTGLFAEQRYHAVILLGDRYETLAVAIAAGNTGTPIFHISGGDTTEGAMDEWIRHSITKMAFLHFVTNEESRKRVIQLGENPERVFNFGSTSIDNILTAADMSEEEALASVGLGKCRYAVCTYHPVTLEDADVDEQIAGFTGALSAYPEMEFIVTKSNADRGGERINALLDLAEQHTANMHVFASLGVRRYLSLIKYSRFVLGNSSSGIVEAPAFHIPTVNIGDRQRGRLQSESVINCGSSEDEIVWAIDKALSMEHRSVCSTAKSFYGDGQAAKRIAEKAVEAVQGRIDLKKRFYDLEFEA